MKFDLLLEDIKRRAGIVTEAGYYGYSKSNNAKSAEEEGRFPASVISKKLKIPTDLIRKYVHTREWHHTSKTYNKTPYYDMNVVAVTFGLLPEDEDEGLEHNPEAIAALKSWSPNKKETVLRGDVTWLDWVGHGKRKRPVEYTARNIKIIVRGSFIYFDDERGKAWKKKINSNGTFFSGKTQDGDQMDQYDFQ